MVDLATVITSVGATLSIQCLYFVWIRFPEELHKSISQGERLSALEDEEYSIYKRKSNAIKESEQAIAEWMKLVEALETRDSDAPIDRDAFRNSLSPLTETLGKVRGLISAFDRAGFNQLLEFEEKRLEIQRSLTLSIINFKTPAGNELSNTISELSLLHSTIMARLDQVASESEIRDVEFKVQISEAEATVSSIWLRLYIATVFVGVVGAIAATTGASQAERIIWSGRNVSRWDYISLNSLCVVAVGFLMILPLRRIRRQLDGSIWQQRRERKKKLAGAQPSEPSQSR